MIFKLQKSNLNKLKLKIFSIEREFQEALTKYFLGKINQR